MDTLKFSLARQRQNVELASADGTSTTQYYLQEMDGVQRDAFLQDGSSRMEILSADGDKEIRTRIKDYKGMHAKLICLCLIEVASGQAPTEALVQSWPAQVQVGLYKAAQQLNKLAGAEEGPSKKD